MARRHKCATCDNLIRAAGLHCRPCILRSAKPRPTCKECGAGVSYNCRSGWCALCKERLSPRCPCGRMLVSYSRGGMCAWCRHGASKGKPPPVPVARALQNPPEHEQHLRILEERAALRLPLFEGVRRRVWVSRCS